jgi:hypothetical protein
MIDGAQLAQRVALAHLEAGLTVPLSPSAGERAEARTSVELRFARAELLGTLALLSRTSQSRPLTTDEQETAERLLREVDQLGDAIAERELLENTPA